MAPTEEEEGYSTEYLSKIRLWVKMETSMIEKRATEVGLCRGRLWKSCNWEVAC